MRTRAFNVLAALSAVLFVVAVAVWVRSYFVTDVIRYQPRVAYVLHGYTIAWGQGYVGMGVDEARPRPQDLPPLWLESNQSIPLHGDWATPFQWFHVAGVRFATRDDIAMLNVPFREYFLFVPCWLATLVTAILPAVWLRRRYTRRRVERRRDASQCVACGYDLRATPGRCPECGAAAAA